MGRRREPIGELADPDVAGFAEGLRELLRQAGSPTLSELAATTFCGRTTLGNAFSGVSLPTWTTAQAIIRALAPDQEERLEISWLRTRAEVARRRNSARPTSVAVVGRDDDDVPHLFTELLTIIGFDAVHIRPDDSRKHFGRGPAGHAARRFDVIFCDYGAGSYFYGYENPNDQIRDLAAFAP